MSARSALSGSIPKILIQTSARPLDSDYVERLLREVGKDWEYLYFSDADILDFFSAHPLDLTPNIAERFAAMPTGAHKADLFRYFFLYQKGGVFIDSDAILCRDLDLVAADCGFFACASFHEATVFQGFIGCRPGHDILRAALLDAYATEPQLLVDDYLLFCERMNTFVRESPASDVRLYEERKINEDVAEVVDAEKRLLLLHFHQYERIPRFYSIAVAKGVYKVRTMLAYVCHVSYIGTPQPGVQRVSEFLGTLSRLTKSDRLKAAADYVWKLRFFSARERVD